MRSDPSIQTSGIYHVILTAVDSQGLQGSTPMSITIQKAQVAPTPHPTEPEGGVTTVPTDTPTPTPTPEPAESS